MDDCKYCNELKGIVAICDSIDAMTSNRSYRKAHSLQYCYEEIRNNMGLMYDPMLAEYILKHWKTIAGIVQCHAQL